MYFDEQNSIFCARNGRFLNCKTVDASEITAIGSSIASGVGMRERTFHRRTIAIREKAESKSNFNDPSKKEKQLVRLESADRLFVAIGF
jgi:hypothetical protein